MTYENLFDDFINYISIGIEKFKPYINENKIDKEDDIHIWFSLVVTPFIIKSINDNNVDINKKIFSFTVLALTNDNNNIIEVIEFSVLEPLISEFNNKIYKIKPYFGKETLYSYNLINKYII